MTYTYELRFYSPSGVEFDRITDFETVGIATRVNSPGIMDLQMHGLHRIIPNLADKSQIELWYKDSGLGIPWSRYFGGIFRQQYRSLSPPEIFKTKVPGYLSLLGWRHVLWYANTIDRSKFISTSAETIMKTLVNYNAAANATTGNGRLRTGTIAGVSVETDLGRGNTLDWFCAYENLLTTLQRLAVVGGGDFDLVKTGNQAWEFRWYTGQLGADRTASVKFSIELGNMGEPEYEQDRLDEATVVIVGGKNDDADRQIAIRTGPDYSAENDIEYFVNATDADTTAGLNTAGDKALVEKRARDQFQFKILQIPSSVFGVHYFLGDLVTVKNPFTGQESVKKITGAIMGLDKDRRRSIEIEMGTP